MSDKTWGIFQFKREKSTMGQSNLVYFLEIEAPSFRAARKTFKSIPVDQHSWRWIDSYDYSRESYDVVSYEACLQVPEGFKSKKIATKMDIYFDGESNQFLTNIHFDESGEESTELYDENNFLRMSNAYPSTILKQYPNAIYLDEENFI